jgi:hypothetical protein
MKGTSSRTGMRLCTHHDAAQISKLLVSFSYPAIRFVTYIVDSNSRRHEGFVHGSGQKVLASGLIREYCPAFLFLTCVTCEREVRKQLVEMGVRFNFFARLVKRGF